MGLIVQLLVWVVYALSALVLVDVIISYLVAFRGSRISYHPIVRGVHSIVNPMLEPIRRILPPVKTANLDFSPMILLIVLSVIRTLLLRIY